MKSKNKPLANLKNQGYTLMEILISLVVSSILISGILTVYLNTKDHYAKNNALQEIAEEINFLNLLLNRAIYGAGYLGYLSWQYVSVYDDIQKKILISPIIFWNAQDLNLPENIQKKIRRDTQAIELRQMDFRLTNLSHNAKQGEKEIIVENNVLLAWKNKDHLLVADTRHAEINQIISIKKFNQQQKCVQFVQPLHYSYPIGSYVGKYMDRIYFVGETGNKFSNGKPIYGLYVNNEEGMTEEISDIVSNMDFWMGKRQNNNIDYVKEQGEQFLSQIEILKIKMTLSVPYLVAGEFFSKDLEFFIGFRE